MSLLTIFFFVMCSVWRNLCHPISLTTAIIKVSLQRRYLIQQTKNSDCTPEWIKHTAEGCTIVAVLNGTVAFAAAYTMPGGPNQNTGAPLLLHHPFFMVFTVGDVLTISSALTSVVLFHAITSSPFQFVDFSHSLTNNLAIGLILLFLSVCVTMIAFTATVLPTVRNGEGLTKAILYAMATSSCQLGSLHFHISLSIDHYKKLTSTCTRRHGR